MDDDDVRKHFIRLQGIEAQLMLDLISFFGRLEPPLSPLDEVHIVMSLAQRFSFAALRLQMEELCEPATAIDEED